MSTDVVPTAVPVVGLDEPWALSPAVALRPEPFGALAYHFGNRRLTFVKSLLLVQTIQSLADHPDVRSTLDAVGVAADEQPGYAEALTGLARADMIRRRV